MSTPNPTPYLLGRLFAALVHKGARATLFPPNAPLNPALLAQPLNHYTAAANETELDWLAPLMEEIPMTAFARALRPEEETSFWVGYYHQKNALAAGLAPAPAGTGAEAERKESILKVALPPSLHEWVRAHGGSVLVRGLIEVERGRRTE